MTCTSKFLLGQPLFLTSPPTPSWAAPTPQPQQTTSANASSIFSSTINRPIPPHVQGRIEFYRSSADENSKSAEEMGRKLEAMHHIRLDLEENPHINPAKLLQKLKDTVGFILYYKICEEYAHAMKGSQNAQMGEQLLLDNFRNILRVKDGDGRNLLEQVAAYYASRNEICRGQRALSEIGEILEKQADVLEKARGLPLYNKDQHSSHPTAGKYLIEAGTLKAQAKDIFESLPAPAMEAICKRIWELDGKGDKGPDYGRNTILAGLEKLISYKSACPIKDALGMCAENLLKGAVIQASYLNAEHIQRNDSWDTVKEIKKLYELEDLQKFLKDPSKQHDFLAGKYLNLSPDLSALLNKAIWIASYKPLHHPGDFSKNHVCKDVHVLSYIKNEQGVDIISQLMVHQQEKIKAQRLITEIESFILNAAKKSTREEFYRLNDTTQKYLRERVWKRDGGDRDPYFGRPDYGEWKIDTDPNTLYVGNSATHFPAPIDVRVIKDQISKADAALLQDLEAHKVIPKDPIDVSSRTILESDPGLLDYLPENLRTVHVAAELSGVASVGGLASAVDGMVRADGPKNARIIMPLYRGDGSPISKAIFDSLKPKPEYNITVNWEEHRVFKANVNGIKVYFIDDPRLFYIPPEIDHATGAASTGDIYGGDYLTVAERWITFQSAASEVIWKFYKKKNPFQLVHLHDAQTGLIPKILASRHPDEWRRGETPATLFTFHNVNDPCEYKGPARKFLKQHGIPERDTNSLVEATTDTDMLNTVSDQYSLEVQTPIHGNGMDPDFKKAGFGGRMAGIVNGNSNGWDPTKDEQLRTWKSVLGPTLGQTIDLRFGPDSPDLADKIKTIQREICAYLKSLHPEDPAYAVLDPEKPIVFYVGRYAWDQKGVDKFKVIMEETLRNGAQFVCVGTGAKPGSLAHKMLQDMKNFAKARGNKGILVLEDVRENGRLKYQQNKFGSLIRAACTLAIFPSFSEPCGLVQGELKRFGKLIVATRTGGFVNTIKTEGTDRNGYLFTRRDDWWNDPEQANAIINTLRIAIQHAHQIQRDLYHGDPKRHLDLMRTTMYNEIHSTWDETPDGSLTPMDKYDRAAGLAFKNSKKRGQLNANLKTLKV